MKLIGILGGTSWPSTMLPYKMMNEDVQRRLGGHHSARIVLYSIDYDSIKSRYWDRWTEIPPLLAIETAKLFSFRPDCWMLANNTLHKAYDTFASNDQPIPFFHGVRLTRDHLVEHGLRSVLLIGTKFTMEDDYFAGPLSAAGVNVVVPDEADRERIQSIQSRLSRGEMEAGFRRDLAFILKRYERGCAAVVTACTELPLVVDQATTEMIVVDPLVLQCKACVDFALS